MAEQNGTPFKWNKVRNDAALLVAEDDLTDIAIAERVGIGRTTLFTWKQHADFQARVKEHIAELEAAVLKYAIAKKRNRVARQNADWLRLQRIREERAADPSMANVPGGTTGLVVRQLKTIGGGFNAQIVEEFVTDGPLVKAQSDLEKQASGEVGDDPPVKVRHGGDPDNPTPIEQRGTFTILIDSRRDDDADNDRPADGDVEL